MVKKLELPQTRHHVFIFDEDWDWLVRNYGPASPHPEVGVSQAVRLIIRDKVQQLKQRAGVEFDRIRGELRTEGQGNGQEATGNE